LPDIMHDHISALLDAGHEIRLERWDGDTEGGPARYWAHITDRGGANPRTAEGASPAAAIWNASPLHGDDEKMPPLSDLITEVTRDFRDVLGIVREQADPNRRITEVRKDVDELAGELHDEMDVITGRVAALEAEQAGRESDTRIMIRALGDLITRAFPDGLLAARGDEPAPAEGTDIVRAPGEPA